MESGTVRRPTAPVRVVRFDGDRRSERPDRLVTEEPLEIRLHGPGEEPAPLVVTMRTPGHDFELAVGWCLTEGVLRDVSELDSVAYCLSGSGEQLFNVVTVRCRRPVGGDHPAPRPFAAHAGCGVCGKTSIEDLEVRCAPITGGPVVPAAVLGRLAASLEPAQRLFGTTGGLHAAARFRPDGTLVAVREDVGRHNALDKLIGHAALEGALPVRDEVLLVSGRLGFELVQKAAVAGFPVLCAVSAPSGLAVRTAERLGQTVVGFLRDGRGNVYCHPERVAIGAPG